MNIKEASQQTGVNATTIRYYEKEGLILAIDRNDVGVRAIDECIIRRINFVKTMRAAGMSIEALKEYIRLFDAQEDNTAQQFKLLNDQIVIMEEKRDDLQTAIDHLRWKVDHYEDQDHMAVTEEELRAAEKNGNQH